MLVLAILLMEFIELKFDGIETLLTGKSVVVIENGQLLEKNMRKLRLTTDKLEMRLRQAGISSISDVQWATIEVSGNLGYQRKTEKQPATKEDIQRLIHLLEGKSFVSADKSITHENIFAEIMDGHQVSPPKNLQ